MNELTVHGADPDAGFSVALQEMVSHNYKIQVSDRSAGLISSDWSPWECMTASENMWGAALVGRTAGCRKRMSVMFRQSEARLNATTQICTQAASASVGTWGAESCRDNDWRPYAEIIQAEAYAIAQAIPTTQELAAQRLHTKTATMARASTALTSP